MTVTSTAVRSGPYVPNGVTTNFPFTFQAASVEEVRVYRVDAALGEFDVTSGFTVNLNPDRTGSVVFDEAPVISNLLGLYIESSVSFEQLLEIENQGAFLAQVHEEGFDRSTARDNWLRERIGRALIVAPDSVAPSPQDIIAAAQAVAGKADANLINVLGVNFGAKLFLAAGETTARSLTARFGDVINAKAHGMIGDYVVDDTDALRACILLMMQTGRPLYIPEGRYKITGQITVDLDAVPDNGLGQTGKASGLLIYGDGHEKTQLDLRGIVTSPFFRVISSSAANYPVIEDLSIFGNQPGTVLAVGAESLVGPEMNFFRAERCRIQNFNLTAASVAIVVNGLYGASFNSCIINCGSGGFIGGQGTTVICRQANFVTFDTCSIGSAFTAFKFQDGSNASVTIINPDFENVQVCVEFATGTNFSCNLFGGRAAYSSWGVVADACLDCHWYSPNIGASGGGTEDDFIKKPCVGDFTLHGSYPLNVVQPAVPATTVTQINDQGRAVEVFVRPGTATISAILKNGTTTGALSGPIFLAPRDTIAITYTAGTPSWTWTRR